MGLNKREPLPPRLEREPWRLEIEPIEPPSLVMGRWRIYLIRDCIRYAGGDGWGWTRWTYTAARRKGARELLRIQRQEKRTELRTAWMAGGPSIRELRRRLADLENILEPGPGRRARAADGQERARIRELLGPLA